MITDKEYRRKKEGEWIGVRVRFLRKVTTKGGMIAHPGAEGAIRGKRGGFSVQVNACPTCKLSFYCKDVAPSALMIIPGAGIDASV